MRVSFVGFLLMYSTFPPLMGQEVALDPDRFTRLETFRFELSLPPEQLVGFPESYLNRSCPGTTYSSFNFLRQESRTKHDLGSDCKFSAPYVSVFESDAIHIGAFGEVEAWVDTGVVKDGARLASLIQQQSNQGPLSCTDNSCDWIVTSYSSPVVYFSCKTDGKVPIPRVCRPVLIDSGSELKMLAKVGLRFSGREGKYAHDPEPRSADSFSPAETTGPALKIHLSDKKKSDEAIRAAIIHSLSQPQLSLTENPSLLRGVLVAACAPRKSKINANQWEMAQVLAELYQESSEEIDVQYQVIYWVNEQNTDRNIDWHLPTQAQLERFTDEIVHNLRTGLSEVCPSASWSGMSLSCRSK
jgi:hypothetical protein